LEKMSLEPPARLGYLPSMRPTAHPSVGRLANCLRTHERRFILDALRQHHGHNSETARWLGISRRALYDKMRDYGLDGEAAGMRTTAGIMGPRKVTLDR